MELDDTILIQLIPTLLTAQFPNILTCLKAPRYCVVNYPVHCVFPLPLKVLLWIHGGGYAISSGTGNGTDGTYDVGNLDEPLIIVSINYRLNIFGFAASDSLRSRDPLGGTGNYGLLDQRAAMKWVARNIRT